MPAGMLRRGNLCCDLRCEFLFAALLTLLKVPYPESGVSLKM